MLQVIYLINIWNKVNKTMLIFLQLNEEISLIKTWLARVAQKRKHHVYGRQHSARHVKKKKHGYNIQGSSGRHNVDHMPLLAWERIDRVANVACLLIIWLFNFTFASIMKPVLSCIYIAQFPLVDVWFSYLLQHMCALMFYYSFFEFGNIILLIHN